MVDIGAAAGKVFSPVVSIIMGFFRSALILALLAAIAFLAGFFISCRFHPLHLTADKLRKPYIRFKYYDLLRWLLVDFLERGLHAGEFREYGFTFYVGRQGTGKTISMVRYLELMKAKYPNCLIVTNFQYFQADYIMESWRDLLTIRNGTDGVIFAIDEIHSEYSAAAVAYRQVSYQDRSPVCCRAYGTPDSRPSLPPSEHDLPGAFPRPL